MQIAWFLTHYEMKNKLLPSLVHEIHMWIVFTATLNFKYLRITYNIEVTKEKCYTSKSYARFLGFSKILVKNIDRSQQYNIHSRRYTPAQYMAAGTCNRRLPRRWWCDASSRRPEEGCSATEADKEVNHPIDKSSRLARRRDARVLQYGWTQR